MHTAIALVRPEQFHGQVWLLLVQATVVIGVDDTHVALPGVDGLQHGDVIGEHVGGEVIHPTLDDFFSLGRAMGFDQGGGQRLVVDFFRRAQAQAAFPLLVGQSFVVGQVARLYPVGGIGDRPRTQAQTGPGVGR